MLIKTDIHYTVLVTEFKLSYITSIMTPYSEPTTFNIRSYIESCVDTKVMKIL